MEQNIIISNKPNISWIKPSNIESSINSNNFNIDYLETLNKFKSSGIKTLELREVAQKIADGPFGSQLVVEEYRIEGFPVYRVKNIVDTQVLDDDIVYINDEKQKQLKRSEVLPGDVLITKAGRIGSAATIPSRLGIGNITSHLVLVRLKEVCYNYYLVAYLESRYGKIITSRESHKSTRPELTKTETENILIPIPSSEIQKYIGDKVRKAEELREEAKVLKKEAEEMLQSELHIDINFTEKIENKQTWVKENKIYEANITADYYRQIYMEIEKRIDMSELKFHSLEEVTKGILLGNTKKVSDYYCKEGIPYITTKNIKREGVDFSSLLYIPKSIHNNDLKKSKAFPNDILYNKSGNVGLSSLLTEEYKEYNVVSDIIIIRPDIEKVNAYYLVLYLNSKLGKNISERMAGGAIFQHISIYDIAKIKVPILPYEIQTAIGDKKMNSELYDKKSQKLIEEAKKDIEDLIEGNFDLSKIKESN